MPSIKYSFFLFLVVWLGCHSAKDQPLVIINKEVVKSQLVLNPELGQWFLGKQPFNGFAMVYYADGSLAERWGFFNGKKEGKVQKYYPNEQLRYEAFYHENRRVKTARTWTDEGVLIAESNYVNGVTHGYQTKWYASGELFKRLHLNMGKEEGLQQAWRKNGKLYVNYEAKNGRVFGLKRSNLCYELEEETVQF